MDTDYTLDQLKASVQEALATLERQANDTSMPAYVRKRSAKSLARYKSIVGQYPFLLKPPTKEPGA